MLTRRAKAYSSSCSQTVSLSLAISSQFILGVCAAAEDRKKSIETPYFESLLSFKVIDVDTTWRFVVIGSNRFHERLANNGKITTYTGLPLFDDLVRRFLWTQKIETWTIEIYTSLFRHTDSSNTICRWKRNKRNGHKKNTHKPKT